jgi:hypothetical protein
VLGPRTGYADHEVPLTDALTGAAVAPGTAVHLGAWDVRVFASAGTEASG